MGGVETRRTLWQRGSFQLREHDGVLWLKCIAAPGETDDLAELSTDEAEALCRALAAHLRIELPPPGWRVTEMRRRNLVVYEGNFSGKWRGNVLLEGETVEASDPNRKTENCDTAHEACAAVEELSRDTATEPEP